MSSPLASYTATSAPITVSKIWQPTTNPVHFHTSLGSAMSSTGRVYTISHTGFLLSYYILRFKSLVDKPIPTMIEMIIPLVVTQTIWCCACLPRSGHWEARTKGLKMEESTPTVDSKIAGSVGTGKGSMRRKAAPGISAVAASHQGKADSIWSRIVPMFISLILTVMTITPPLILLAILLGAPATTHTTHTGLMALHLALLVGPPLFYIHGVSTQAWREITCAYLPFDEAGVWGGVIGALIGGWLGAVPIPLDWDREWQKWPVTVLTGIWLGWAAGRTILGPIFLRGKRINLRETDTMDFEARIKAASSNDTEGELVKSKKTK